MRHTGYLASVLACQDAPELDHQLFWEAMLLGAELDLGSRAFSIPRPPVRQRVLRPQLFCNPSSRAFLAHLATIWRGSAFAPRCQKICRHCQCCSGAGFGSRPQQTLAVPSQVVAEPGLARRAKCPQRAKPFSQGPPSPGACRSTVALRTG